MTEAQALIDSLETDLDRMRGAIDPALKASMIARLEALRKLIL
ncbi:hypothetical protein [Paraburkholderia panacisoli]|nr:hypothetical protein [Paraburkholderia panacisoli]